MRTAQCLERVNPPDYGRNDDYYYLYHLPLFVSASILVAFLVECGAGGEDAGSPPFHSRRGHPAGTNIYATAYA